MIINRKHVTAQRSSLSFEERDSEARRIQKIYEDRERLLESGKYSLKNAGNVAIKREKEQHLLSWLQRGGYIPLRNTRILDVGCGKGYSLRTFLSWGCEPHNLFGIDVIPSHVEQAKRSLPGVNLQVGNALRLNYPDENFNLVQQVTVFSSILRQDFRQRIAKEMLRVLKIGGHIIWYDACVDNPWNHNVRRIGKREIEDLFPGCEYQLERITVAPPIARILGRFLPGVYDRVSKLKLMASYYLGFFEKKKHLTF